MAVHKLHSRDQAAIPSLQRKSAEVRRAASDTIRAAEEHLMRAEAVVAASTKLIDRAKATLNALTEEHQGQSHPEQK